MKTTDEEIDEFIKLISSMTPTDKLTVTWVVDELVTGLGYGYQRDRTIYKLKFEVTPDKE